MPDKIPSTYGHYERKVNSLLTVADNHDFSMCNMIKLNRMFEVPMKFFSICLIQNRIEFPFRGSWRFIPYEGLEDKPLWSTNSGVHSDVSFMYKYWISIPLTKRVSRSPQHPSSNVVSVTGMYPLLYYIDCWQSSSIVCTVSLLIIGPVQTIYLLNLRQVCDKFWSPVFTKKKKIT